jgi:hypothetical protein
VTGARGCGGAPLPSEPDAATPRPRRPAPAWARRPAKHHYFSFGYAVVGAAARQRGAPAGGPDAVLTFSCRRLGAPRYAALPLLTPTKGPRPQPDTASYLPLPHAARSPHRLPRRAACCLSPPAAHRRPPLIAAPHPARLPALPTCSTAPPAAPPAAPCLRLAFLPRVHIHGACCWLPTGCKPKRSKVKNSRPPFVPCSLDLLTFGVYTLLRARSRLHGYELVAETREGVVLWRR